MRTTSAPSTALFEIAHRGTIFLDEINSIPPLFQAKLICVLQEKEIKRIGSESVIPIDVRVIAASNIELSTRSHKSGFRPDLFYPIKRAAIDNSITARKNHRLTIALSTLHLVF